MDPFSPAVTSSVVKVEGIPELAPFNLGPKLLSGLAVELTESEAAFPVSVVKHLYPAHVVLQFTVSHTLEGGYLKNVSVLVTPKDSRFRVTHVTTLPSLEFQESGHIFALISRPSSDIRSKSIPVASFTANLLYYLHDVDTNTGAIDEDADQEELALDVVEFSVGDYFSKVSAPSFTEAWNGLGESGQAVTTFSLSTVSNLTQGVNEMIKFFGMVPCDQSSELEKGATKHILYLSGKFVDVPPAGLNVLARIRMRVTPQHGVGMELTVRSSVLQFSQALAGALFS
eukprot:TRINITY_DN6732_c0_g1_i1.p1 TRINITY_DN6732_c0_g1~~TRINITY_DN6732_c0_g1_i1.p1  ORF type:complete len:285 (-),score=58.05 TRINITY_DN6732_c0_g1_i1:46-900(-)